MRDGATLATPWSLFRCEDMRRRQPSYSLGGRCVPCCLAEAFASACLFRFRHRALHILILAFLVSLVREISTSERTCYLVRARSM